MTLLTTLLAFAVTIGILVSIHEFGHFWVAKKCGVKILRYSIGFGKPLFIWKNKKDPDQTEWAVSPIPLGGYVRMLDERDPECLPIKPEEAHRAFGAQSVYKRFAIVAAGPVSNIILAILLYSLIFLMGSTEPAAIIDQPKNGTVAALAGFQNEDKILKVGSSPIKSYAQMRFELLKRTGEVVPVQVEHVNETQSEKQIDLTGFEPSEAAKGTDPFDALGLDLKIYKAYISGFSPDSAAQQAGIEVGDQFIAINGVPVADGKQTVELIRKNGDNPLEITVRTKSGAIKTYKVLPHMHVLENGSKIPQIGAMIGIDYPKVEISYGLFGSLVEGAKKTWDTVEMSFEMIWKMIKGDVSVKNISGPVTIADYAGQTARLGFSAFISFLALVSISLGVLNLLPIPMLDGGHLLYYSVEMIRGKPVSQSVQTAAQKVGIVVLCGLTVLALFNDLTRLLP